MLHIQDINSVTQSLQVDLKGFGLNPQDWQLQQTSNDRWLILSKDDPEFAFQGRTQKKHSGWAWQQVQLISL